jgi:hypothetical protein
LCSGCGLPRHETFADPPPTWTRGRGRWEERYDVTVLACAACAARERKAWNTQSGREHGTPPPFGEYFAISGPNLNGFFPNVDE